MAGVGRTQTIKPFCLAEITLAVFNFNSSTIAGYRKLGFREYEFRPNVRQIDGEFWNLMMMKLDRKHWHSQLRKNEQGPAH